MCNFRLATAGTIVALGAACVAHAQTADSGAAGNAASTDPKSSVSVEEVTVTARRVRENLQDTPIAVTAFSPAALESRSIQGTLDLQQFVPNLNSTSGYSGGSYANYFIRGVGQGLQDTGVDPGVGLYIDGVYIGRANGADISTLDLDHVEVLRGPQGTLFGKNTLGGAINVFTRQPTNDNSGEIKLTSGSRDWYEARGWVNTVIVPDKLLARVSLDAKTQDGYGIDIGTGHRFGDIRTESFHSNLLYRATDELTFDLLGDYRHIRGTGNMVKMTAIGSLGYIPPPIRSMRCPATCMRPTRTTTPATASTAAASHSMRIGSWPRTSTSSRSPLIEVSNSAAATISMAVRSRSSMRASTQNSIRSARSCNTPAKCWAGG